VSIVNNTNDLNEILTMVNALGNGGSSGGGTT
jgi:hypothetical protein